MVCDHRSLGLERKNVADGTFILKKIKISHNTNIVLISASNIALW